MIPTAKSHSHDRRYLAIKELERGIRTCSEHMMRRMSTLTDNQLLLRSFLGSYNSDEDVLSSHNPLMHDDKNILIEVNRVINVRDISQVVHQ